MTVKLLAPGCAPMVDGWTSGLAATATGAQLTGPADLRLEGIVTDTRELPPGALFVALRGESFDGHDFIPQAFAAGAAAVVTDRAVTPPAGKAALLVPDTLRALGDLARWWRAQYALTVVGVTGSVGKSSTKEMVAAVLGRRWLTLASQGSFNNEIGLPKTLLQLTAQHGAAVLEMAMRGPGEIGYLAAIAQPTIGVITNIGFSHVGRLGSRQAIAAAKGELLEHLGDRGVAVLNADDDHLAGLAVKHSGRTLWYSLDHPADVTAENVSLDGLEGSRFTLRTPAGEAPVQLGLPGRHMVHNALAAAAVGHAAGLDAATIAAGLASAGHLPLRLAMVSLPSGLRVINDAYNAAPSSMRAALEVLANAPVAGRRIAVLGDMLEMGQHSEVEHLKLGQDAAKLADVVVGVGELGGLIAAGARDAGHRHVLTAPDAGAAGELLAALATPTDLVLLKASRGVGLERALEHLS